MRLLNLLSSCRSRMLLPLITIVAISLPVRIAAQEAPYKFDIGAQLGMSGYLGDVNESNMFRRPGMEAALQFRYIINTRWSLRSQLGLQTLKGDSRDFGYVFPAGAHYSFSSTVYDVSERVEFNFFPYGIGETYKRLRRWTPYVAVGLGASLASAKGGGSHVAMIVPMTVGFKYKPAERWNLALEFNMVKTFGDHADGEIADLYTIKSSFVKNTDWYSGICFSVSYEFGRRCETCNRID